MGTVNRNAPCPCGSGRKYKKCCMAAGESAPAAKVADGSESWGKKSRGRDQDNEVDRLIIQGYDFQDKQDYDGACQAWGRLWDYLLLRLSPRMTSCALTLPLYDGSFELSNWMQNYCAVLHSAAFGSREMAGLGASFCDQVLLQFPDESTLLLENFRASLGEFLYLAGKHLEGEKVLNELIAEHPDRAIGYACFSDMLGDARYHLDHDEPRDLSRAVEVLEKGLAYPVQDAADYNLDKRLLRFREVLDS